MNTGDPDWTAKMTAIGTLVLAVAASIALLQLRQARRARYAQAATEAARRWDDPAFREFRARIQALVKQHGGPERLGDHLMSLRDSSAKDYFELLTIMDYFEDLEILRKSRAISFRMINDSLGTTVCSYWSIYKPFVLQLRRRNNDYRNYENFEQLSKRISKGRGYSVHWA